MPCPQRQRSPSFGLSSLENFCGPYGEFLLSGAGRPPPVKEAAGFVISAGGGGVLNYTNGFRVRAENGEAGTRRAGRGGGCSAIMQRTWGTGLMHDTCNGHSSLWEEETEKDGGREDGSP
eukprot:EG_transcript_10040